MSSLDVRNNSAVMKRAEQLKRWEESETNREPPSPRPEDGRRIKFSSGCVFLAACLAGDKEEVLKLLESGADINTANVDGLTALHQACIDDNLEMVEFLVENGADINRQDNEGWTPLHATASCGFVSIARYLVEHDADVAAVNSDGDLAVDLAVDIQHLGMIDFMQKMVADHNIDCEKARQAEEQQMLSDAKRWLRSDASEVDRPHPKTGATPLHVAAAKGYTKVLSLLLAGRANVDKQDNDGWTPLHAASHWGQKEAAEMLVDAMADMDVRNYAGQSCIDVAERKMVKFLEELRANNKRLKRRPSSQINSRISDTIESHIDNAASKIIRVEVRPDQSKDQSNVGQHLVTLESDSNSFGDVGGDDSSTVDDGNSDGGSHHNLTKVVESDETDSELTDSTESSHSTSISEAEDDKSNPVTEPLTVQPQEQQPNNDDEAPWRRNSLATRTRTPIESPTKNQVPDKDHKNTTSSTEASDVILRRTQSFENDEKFYQKYNELRARIKANSCPILPASLTNNNPSVLGTANTTIQNYSVQRSASLKDHRNFRKPATTTTTATTATATTATTTMDAPPTTTHVVTTTSAITTSISATTTTTITTPVRSDQNSPPRATENITISPSNTASNQINNNNEHTAAASNEGSSKVAKKSAGNILKNFFKSFVPPVRDEESETQRKAHAKRVRETRRSTQGVTLDEIKSAEELVKKKNSSISSNSDNTTDSSSSVSSNDNQTSKTSLTTSQVLRAQQETGTTSPTPTPLPTKVEAEMIDTTATTTPTAPVAPKIPTTDSSNDALDKSELIIDDNDDDITATFTIVTPTVKHRFPANTEHDELDEISATFTMTSRHESRTPTPTSESYITIETTIMVTPPEITIDAPQDEKNDEDVDGDGDEDEDEDVDVDGDGDVDVEAMNEEGIKPVEVQLNELCASNDSLSSLDCTSPKDNEKNETENLETLTQTATPTVLNVALKAEEPQVNSGTSSESEATRGTTFAPLPPQPVPSCVAGPTPTPTLDSPVRMREKRSIFDLDNMNSLSLAEKLRNEANKYNDDRNFTAISDQAASDSDRDSVFSNYSRRSLDSSPLHMGSAGGGGVGASSTERRPSWRLKFDAGCKFKLEDASSGTSFSPTNSTIIPSAPAVIAAANLSSSTGQRRTNSTSNAINSSTQSLNSIGRPVSAPTAVNASSSVTNVGDTQSNDRILDPTSSSYTTRRLNAMASTTTSPTPSITPSSSSTASASITSAYTASSLLKSGENKENDKEHDSRSSAATQAVLQRRRKPKRRSTGVVHLDMDDLDPERQETNTEHDDRESGNERGSRSRIGSTASSTTASTTDDNKSRVRSENGGDLIDYKALWEAVKLENEKLKQLLKKKDDEAVQSRATLERFTNATTKNSLSEIEKRERRAMERKLSEMEEELKLLQRFKTDNERLRAENRALTRVVSKLTISTQNRLQNTPSK